VKLERKKMADAGINFTSVVMAPVEAKVNENV